MEGDTTNFYIYKQIQDYDVATTTIARGISVGDELEYADELTLGRSIISRVPYRIQKNNSSDWSIAEIEYQLDEALHYHCQL